jgi:hypothetical protein
MKKVFLAALLCLLSILLFNFKAADVHAESVTGVSSLEELVAAANNQSIRLDADITLTAHIIFTNVDLDLNGHTLNVGDKTIMIKDECTIKDTSSLQSGKIESTGSFAIQIGSMSLTGELTVLTGKIAASQWGVRVIDGKLILNGGEINANSYAVYLEANGEAVINDGKITVNGYPAIQVKKSLTVNGGHIEAFGDGAAINLYGNCSAVINDGVIKALYVDPNGRTGGQGITAFKNTSLTMTGGSIVSYSFGIAGNGSAAGSNEGTNATFTITGGSITSQYGAGIYSPQVNGAVNISGGTVTGGACGIEIRSGELNISGGIISGSQESFSSSNTRQGDVVKGCAVSVFQHSTKQPISVNISDGTFYGYIPFNEGNYWSNPDDAIEHIDYSITGGTFVSSSDCAIKVEDMKNGKFVKGGKYINSVNNGIPNLSPYIVDGYGEFEETPGGSPDSYWMVRPLRNLEITDNGLGKASAEYTGKAYYNGVLVNDMFFADMLVSLKAVPNDGYVLNKWECISGKAGISNNMFIMPDEDLKLKAIFAGGVENLEQPEGSPVIFVKDFLDPLKEKLEDAIENKGKQTVYWNEGDSLSYDIMKILEDHPDITLVFDYTYQEKDYHVVIPGRMVKTDPTIDWYGPLYLFGVYGRYSLTDAAGSASAASSGMYVIRSGDTLESIAHRFNTTVNNLAELNGIKDPNRIYSGQTLRY